MATDYIKKTDVMTLKCFAEWAEVDLIRLRKERINNAKRFPKTKLHQRGIAFYEINALMDFVLEAGGKTEFNAGAKLNQKERKETVVNRGEFGPIVIEGICKGWAITFPKNLLIAHRALSMGRTA
jgi:hypothetical protein